MLFCCFHYFEDASNGCESSTNSFSLGMRDFDDFLSTEWSPRYHAAIVLVESFELKGSFMGLATPVIVRSKTHANL